MHLETELRLKGKQTLIDAGHAGVLEYKKETQNVKNQIKDMTIRLQTKNEEILKMIQQQLETSLKELHLQISQQKTENENLQKQITEIKKEKSELQQFIITCRKKLETLETEIVSY